MDNSFAHNDHHQAISQKLKKAGTHSTKSSVYMGSHFALYVPDFLIFAKWPDDDRYIRN